MLYSDKSYLPFAATHLHYRHLVLHPIQMLLEPWLSPTIEDYRIPAPPSFYSFLWNNRMSPKPAVNLSLPMGPIEAPFRVVSTGGWCAMGFLAEGSPQSLELQYTTISD